MPATPTAPGTKLTLQLNKREAAAFWKALSSTAKGTFMEHFQSILAHRPLRPAACNGAVSPSGGTGGKRRALAPRGGGPAR